MNNNSNYPPKQNKSGNMINEKAVTVFLNKVFNFDFLTMKEIYTCFLTSLYTIKKPLLNYKSSTVIIQIFI